MNRYEKVILDLNKYIPCNHFRTVESFKQECAPTEIKVFIEMKESFAKSLYFNVSWNSDLYAYYRYTNDFVLFCKENNINMDEIRCIYLEDWDEKFMLSIEMEDELTEYSYFVNSVDVKNLLENCCKIPEQKKRKDSGRLW